MSKTPPSQAIDCLCCRMARGIGASRHQQALEQLLSPSNTTDKQLTKQLHGPSLPYLYWPFISLFALSLCTLTGPYTLSHQHTHTNTHFSHSHIICTYIYTDFTHPLTCKLLLLFLYYILLPSHLTIIPIYLRHSSIPAQLQLVLELTF